MLYGRLTPIGPPSPLCENPLNVLGGALPSALSANSDWILDATPPWAFAPMTDDHAERQMRLMMQRRPPPRYTLDELRAWRLDLGARIEAARTRRAL